MAEIVLLCVAAGLMLVRPSGLGFWAGPVAVATLGLASTLLSFADAGEALEPLFAPLAFLVFAVPLAVALERIGVFAALAASFDGGRHTIGLLWLFAAAVVVVFNLDAAVLLLTPLYIRIAIRSGFPIEALAFQPALLACLASGVLPVSNLTNLIVAERFELGVADFVTHSAAPTAAACVVGYLVYRRVFVLGAVGVSADAVVDRVALRRGLPIIGFVLIGFTMGDLAGVDAWIVAAVACGWASVVAGGLAWRTVPVAAIGVAAALAVLVAAATPSLPLGWFFGGSGPAGDLRVVGFGLLGANVANNLPAVLAGSESVQHVDQVWPLLSGVNVGALLTLTGSLSALLWTDVADRSGVVVDARRYASVGCRVGVPALAAAVVVHVVV